MKAQMFRSVSVNGPEGVRLDPVDISHAEACFEACQDPEIHRWIPLPWPYTRSLAEQWCSSGAEEYRRAGLGIHYALSLDGEFAGCMSFNSPRWREEIVEISYWVSPRQRGKGIAANGVRALTRNAFELGFQRIELRIAPGNTPSRRVAEAVHYTEEGYLRSAGILHGARTDLVLYSAIPSDF